MHMMNATQESEAAASLREANWWFQHYLRTRDPRALRCAVTCRGIALERQREIRIEPPPPARASVVVAADAEVA
jgi:hypothetical protein